MREFAPGQKVYAVWEGRVGCLDEGWYTVKSVEDRFLYLEEVEGGWLKSTFHPRPLNHGEGDVTHDEQHQ